MELIDIEENCDKFSLFDLCGQEKSLLQSKKDLLNSLSSLKK